MSAISNIVPDTHRYQIIQAFERLKANQIAIGNSTTAQRKAKLKKLHKAIMAFRPQIKEAMYKDFRKHPSEVDLTEVYPITSEIKHTRRKLGQWMSNHHIGTPLALVGSSSFVKYEPKGVVLIISPWNFPFNLTFGPLVGAIASGNAVMINPSEITSHASALMKKITEEVFDDNEVILIEGGIETATNLLSLPFNHIFFTGAPSIGKIVMKAAAKNLASITLELGGKSPTIVDETANIETAARRIAWAKFANNGQTCIAPDYVFVHKSIEQKFIDSVKKYVEIFYSENAVNEPSYARIVNERHYSRIKSLVEDAVQNGAEIKLGNQFEDSENFVAPTILTNVPNNSRMMKEEIFGPVMPVHTFTNLDDVITEINAREKPLALYIYSKSRHNIKHIMNNTRAGGGCINHSVVHFFNTNLPFGGANNSGIGKSHGWESFKAFSNARGVLKQHIPNAVELLLPPYNNFKQKLIDFTIKYF